MGKTTLEKFSYMLLGIMVVLVLGIIAVGVVSAGPRECPKGQRDQCDTFEKNGRLACFPDNANPQGWTFVKEGCPKEVPAPPELTNTPMPNFPITTSSPVPFKPSSTPMIVIPSPTIPDHSTATVIVPPYDPKKTPTPTVVLIFNQKDANTCSTDCTCLLVTQAVIANDLQKTQIAIALGQNQCVKP